jgi:hypothetical protein
MYFNRIFLLSVLTILSLACCETEQSEKAAINIQQFSWGTPTNIVLENGFYHSKKSLDTTLNQLVGDTLIPVTISGSKCIITKLEPSKMEMKTIDGTEDFYITEIGFKQDTFIFDVKNYFGQIFLLLVSENSPSLVYILKNDEKKISETNNLIIPDYKVEGYATGDIVNREDIEIISKDQFGTSLTEIAILRDNKNVILKIIDEKYIEEIQWVNINDSDITGIVKQINRSFSKAPDIEYESEEIQKDTDDIFQYYWSENEIHILLTRINEFGDLDEIWSLTYSNSIISNVLNNYREKLVEDI